MAYQKIRMLTNQSTARIEMHNSTPETMPHELHLVIDNNNIEKLRASLA